MKSLKKMIQKILFRFFSVFNVAFNSSFPEIDKKPNKNTLKINSWMTQGLLKSRKKKELFSRKLKNPKDFNIEKIFNNLYVLIDLQKVKNKFYR